MPYLRRSTPLTQASIAVTAQYLGLDAGRSTRRSVLRPADLLVFELRRVRSMPLGVNTGSPRRYVARSDARAPVYQPVRMSARSRMDASSSMSSASTIAVTCCGHARGETLGSQPSWSAISSQ